jgi:hypothetical protein
VKVELFSITTFVYLFLKIIGSSKINTNPVYTSKKEYFITKHKRMSKNFRSHTEIEFLKIKIIKK